MEKRKHASIANYKFQKSVLWMMAYYGDDFNAKDGFNNSSNIEKKIIIDMHGNIMTGHESTNKAK